MVRYPFLSVPASAGHRRWRAPDHVRCALVAAALLAVLAAQAQPATKAARPDPLDPKASVPALGYQSPFSQYRRLGEDQPLSWRDANDTVTRIGGWRVYTREAQQPDPAPPAPKPANATAVPKPNEPAKPMPAGHGGHKMP